MEIRRTVHGMSTVASERPVGATVRVPWISGGLAVLVAISIAVWAFVDGDQPVVADARGYYDYGKLIATVGPKSFASDLRTYGYPAFLAGIMRVVGEDVEDVRVAVFVVQLGLLIAATWIGARRVEGAFGQAGLGRAVFVVTVANPFLLFYSVQLLTDLPAALLVYLAVALSLPQRRPEPASRVIPLAAAVLLCAGCAVMLRPAMLLAAVAVVGIWIARAAFYRDVPWIALPVALLALALPFVPQAWSNHRAFGVAHPLVVSSLYETQLIWGLMYLKYATLLVPGVTSSVYYDNPFRPPPELTPSEALLAYPGAYLVTVAIHAFALVDQDYPFAYIRDVDPWYRWPLSVLNYVFFLGAFVGIAIGLRGTTQQSGEPLRRQRFGLLGLCGVAVAVTAIYLPTAVESRFALPLHLLLAPASALAAMRVYAALPTASAWRLSLGSVAVAAWVGIAASASVWVQGHASVLVAVREGRAGPPAEASQGLNRVAPAPAAPPAPVAPPVPTTVPPEIPSARYVAELPRELTISTGTIFDVTVTNTGREVWNVRGPHAVGVASRFIAQRTELHERVKGLMKESQTVELPGDVAPGATATVRMRILAPPIPGRYTLLVHVTRFGVPDSRTNIERVVRVVD